MSSSARNDLFKAVHEAAAAMYGERLMVMAIFGSWARGVATPASDLDLLIVAEPLPPSRMKRVREFRPVADATRAVRSRVWSHQGPEIELSPVFKTPEELAAGSPLYLDMTLWSVVLLDRGGMLEVARDDLYIDNPHAILETFLVYQQTPGLQGLSSRTLRALYNARSVMDGRFRNDPVNRETFRKIIMQHDGITHAMRLMNQTSVLGRYLWVFRRIVGQMQHDLFHVYTVDQHILMVLRRQLRRRLP